MSILADIFTHFMLVRPSRNKSYTQLGADIAKEGQAIEARIAKASDSEKNRKQLSHLIGIERWAQSRVNVALGGPYIQDEYDEYRPNRDASWAELGEAFSATRQQSIELANQVESANVPATTTVKHNDFGEITMRSWLRYIAMHASFESKRIK